MNKDLKYIRCLMKNAECLKNETKIINDGGTRKLVDVSEKFYIKKYKKRLKKGEDPEIVIGECEAYAFILGALEIKKRKEEESVDKYEDDDDEYEDEDEYERTPIYLAIHQALYE